MGFCKKIIAENDEENDAVGEVVNVSATDFESKVGKIGGDKTRDGESAKETDQDKKRNFFAGFGTQVTPGFHGIILSAD